MKIFKIILAVFALLFAAALAGCGGGGASQHPTKTQTPSDNSTQSPSSTAVEGEIVAVSPLGAVDIDKIRSACTMVSDGSPCPQDRFSYAERVGCGSSGVMQCEAF
jgi:predicted small lipoprotein YifL